MDGTAFNNTAAFGHDQILDGFDVPPNALWDNWWQSEQTWLAGAGQDEAAADEIYAQSGVMSAEDTGSYGTSLTECSPWPTPATESAYFPGSAYGKEVSNSPADEGKPSVAPAAQRKRKHKQESSKSPCRKSAKRKSTPSTDTDQRLGQRSTNSKMHHKSPQYNEKSMAETIDEDEERSKLSQQRNRIASIKFRVKKRESAIKLRSDEQDIERINRKLNSCVAGLTQDVHALKMQLLQHSDCNCNIIQAYISNEAHKYIQSLYGKIHTEGSQSQSCQASL